jgi:hypothetical protein
MTDQPKEPIERYLPEPDLDSIAALFEAMTGRRVSDEELEEVAREFAGMIKCADPSGKK